MLMLAKLREAVMLFWSSPKICSDGSHSIIRPISMIALGNMLANIWEDMFDNPNVFKCVRFESQDQGNAAG
jgi:hypothetical protein